MDENPYKSPLAPPARVVSRFGRLEFLVVLAVVLTVWTMLHPGTYSVRGYQPAEYRAAPIPPEWLPYLEQFSQRMHKDR